ncbi:MAG TPA: DUF4167 domain-containing protein [Hyphomonadaceae bacterium]
MKRQRGRGRKPGGGGGGGHNHGNRSLESNGPDVKIRGTAAQIYEKYSQYARDAQSAGDRVKYENLLQHAEHYFRIMVATMPRDRLFQQQGEGGAPMQGQGMQGSEGGGQLQPAEGAVPGDVVDPLKVVDDQQGDDDGDYDDGDDDRDGGGDDVEAGGGDDQRGDPNQQQGDRQGRRRRRGRRRHHDGDRSHQQAAGGQNATSGGGGDSNEPREPREPRSALDSLARRQGAIAGS